MSYWKGRKQDTPINIVIIRIEQLFPLDKMYIKEAIEKYNVLKSYFGYKRNLKTWEAWTFILSELRSFGIDVISRESSACSPLVQVRHHL